MIVVSVSYPNTEGTRFDETYYLERHMPLVHHRWASMGLQEAKVLRGLGTPDGGRGPVRITALLTFESEDAFRKAVEAHGAELFGDIPNFTDTHPAVQLHAPAG
jgi:uncharacterized protein (TIGR02118 family)